MIFLLFMILFNVILINYIGYNALSFTLIKYSISNIPFQNLLGLLYIFLNLSYINKKVGDLYKMDILIKIRIEKEEYVKILLRKLIQPVMCLLILNILLDLIILRNIYFMNIFNELCIIVIISVSSAFLRVKEYKLICNVLLYIVLRCIIYYV